MNSKRQVVVNQDILEMEYAVRGPIPIRAAELKRQGKKTIPCNIGNPQALGQQPISYYRKIISLIEEPGRLDRERFLNKHIHPEEGLELLPEQVLDTASFLLKNMETGMGAYTESSGPLFIRRAIADFIDKRDKPVASQFKPADPNSIFITNGASEGAKYVIDMLISKPTDGIMIPIPQYPLYSATIRKCGGTQVNYYPDEDSGWTISRAILEDAYRKATSAGVTVKCMVVINPGNPTGSILDDTTIEDVINFAHDHGICIIADEVYQENLYGAQFRSFASAVGDRDVPLFSLHSISKGFYGECGHRGGYLEVRNAPDVSNSRLTVIDVLVKQASVSLCSNTVGQVLTYLMVTPPAPGSDCFAQFDSEKKTILNNLREKAEIIKAAFTKMEGVECYGRVGAMYLFPRLNKLPAGKTDFDYCMALLEETGLCTVNGSGFGQKEGTSHLRIAFLPPKDMLEQVLPEWITFHNRYVNS